MPRRLDADETALWARVTATVRPLHRIARPAVAPEALPSPAPAARPTRGKVQALPDKKPVPAANTLDGGWDRRLASGRVAPDVTVDLHGHTLVSAHTTLERRLGDAIAQGHRVMLVITGRPPRPNQNPERPRGLIRQQLPHWLAVSPHRSAVVAVRGAHPRHGGAGALYLILRRRREVTSA